MWQPCSARNNPQSSLYGTCPKSHWISSRSREQIKKYKLPFSSIFPVSAVTMREQSFLHNSEQFIAANRTWLSIPQCHILRSPQEQIILCAKVITKMLFLQSKTSPVKQVPLVVSVSVLPYSLKFQLKSSVGRNIMQITFFPSLMLWDTKLLEKTELRRNQIAYGQCWVLLKQEIRGFLINHSKQFRKQRQLKDFILPAGKSKWKAVSRKHEHRWILSSLSEPRQEGKRSHFICIRHICFLRCCWNTHLLPLFSRNSIAVWYLSLFCFSSQTSQCSSGCRPKAKHSVLWTNTPLFFLAP